MGAVRAAARAGGFVFIVAFLAGAGSVRAEDNTTPLEKIEITGSNIKRAEAATSENVQVITAEEIKRSGQPTVADYLRTVSANFASYNETASNSFAPGSSGIALRGLSQKNTLVLLNGRRIAVFGFQQNLEDTFVDLNVIPAIAVERIEILKSGASAIYGSDATAGVVNIILKQNSTERILDAGVATTTDGGGGIRDAAFSAGIGDFATDKYNLVVTGSLFKRDEILASQRPYTAGQDYRNQPDGYLVWSQSANYVSDANPNQPLAAFPSCGKNGLPGQVLGLYNFYPSTNQTGTTCAYNPASQIDLIPGTERANLTTNGIIRLSPTWTAFADVFYSFVKTTVRETPMSLGPVSNVYNPTTGGVNVVGNTLPVGNPSNPNPNGTTDIDYVFQSVGGLDYGIWSNTYRVSGGVKGTWADWDWSADYGHSENHVVQTYYNGINVSALAKVIANGSYNFLYPGQTPNGSAELRQDFAYAGVSKLDTVGAKTSGEVLSLPAGKVDVAVGTEFRHESINNQPDSNLLNGEVLGFGTQTVIGGRSVFSGFGEITVPILKSLELDLAGREEHYSDVGGNFSPQASLRWHPSSAFTLRAVGSHGFRAPSLPEISNASSVSFTQVTDPFDPLQRPTESIAEVIKANTQLKPETSKNFDIGMVISPTADFNLSIDYYKISVDHVIATQAAPNTIIDNPSQYPGQIFRTNAGLLNYVIVPYENLYKIMTSGYDIEADSTFHLDHGAQIHLAASATYVTALKFFDGTQWNDTTGTNEWYWLSPIAGGGPVPPLRGNVSLGWENADWVSQAALHYTSGYQNYCYVEQICDVTAAYVSAYTTVDLYGEYRGLKNWRFSASLDNVFNTRPPWDYLSQPFDITLYDARGRAIELRAQYKF
jgi:iron complex outermembrane receptor protein